MHIERHTFSLTDSTGQTHTYETFPRRLGGPEVLNYLIAAGRSLAKLLTSTLGPDMSWPVLSPVTSPCPALTSPRWGRP